jgi:death-on-curing protein
MITLNAEQIKQLHGRLLTRTSGYPGIRDEASLEYALSAPSRASADLEPPPSVTAKIAQITFELIRNHPFVDGNKRTGVYAMLVLLELNNIEADFSDDDVYRIGVDIACGDMSEHQLLKRILARAT